MAEAQVRPEKAQLDRKPEKAQWDRKLDFLMASISYAIGLGNLWRFPYQCYRNGGGAFLIPFLIMVLLTGLPLVLSDIALGQFGRKGPLRCWSAAPIMSGIGWMTLALNIEVDVFYCVIVSFTFFYFIASMAPMLPWDSCTNWWNTPDCRDTKTLSLERNCTLYNGTFHAGQCMAGDLLTTINGTNSTINTLRKPVPASDEYFHNYVLQISSGIMEMGIPRWPILLCFLVTLVLIFITLSVNVKSWGKMAYVFTILPYVVLVSLLVQGFFHEGSALGVLYFLKPRWSELANPRVWVDALGQAFFSLGCAGSQLINIASHNPVRGNCVRDALVISVADTLTSLFCGIVAFSVLGQMAHQLNLPIEEAVGKGAGLAFVVYPTALASMPLAPVWSVLFMLALFNLGVGTLVAIVAGLQAVLLEELPTHLQQRRFTKTAALLFALFVFFVVGIIYTTNGGMYILQMMDHNISYVLLVIGVFKAITMGWIYGADRLFADIKAMGGWELWHPLKWIYRIITPGLMILVFVFNLTDLKLLRYGDFVYPQWSGIFAWAIVGVNIAIIPIVAVYKIASYPEKDLTVKQRLKVLCKPTADWGPEELKQQNTEVVQPILLKEIGAV